jgi:outer membrane cobalamin receptor
MFESTEGELELDVRLGDWSLHWVPLLALILAIALSPAEATSLEQIIVTGTRLASADGEWPGAGSVIGRDEIEARGDAGVPDLLRALPGVQLVQPGAGSVPQLFVRGGEPNFTVFLLDGIKVNDPNNTRGGSFDLAALNPGDIDRVEIVRGPQSSVYGSDGLAGVVNVISPAGGGPLAASVEAETGSKDFDRTSLMVAGPAGGGGFSLRLTRRDDGEAVPGSTYQADTVNGRLRFAPVNGIRGNLYLRFADTESTSFPEESGGPELAVLRALDQASARDLSLGADFDTAISEVISAQGVASRYERRDRYDSPGIAPGDLVPPNGAHNELDRDNVSLRLTAGRGGRWTGTAGVDYQRESGESDGYVIFAPGLRLPNSFTLERDIVGIFAEGRAQVTEALLLQASARHDEPDEVSGESTGRVGAVWSPNGGITRVRANWGTGFKLPSFFALGSPLVGEPALRPEQSDSVELGVIQRLGELGGISLTLFDNDYEDLIDFDPDTFRNVNRDEVTTRGVEVDGWWDLSPTLTLRGHATWTDIDVKGSDRELLQRPDWRGGAMLRWAPRDGWLLDLDWLYVGEVLDNSLPTGLAALERYHRVDLNVGWQVTARLRLALAVDNLLDAEYAEAIGFPAAGLRPRLSVRYRFGG